MPPFIISSAFDSGNISCLSADSSDNIQLEILKDHNSDFYQWFYFRLSGARDQECKLHITNASGSAYTKGWTNYKAVASENKKDWRRIKTNFIDGVLIARDAIDSGQSKRVLDHLIELSQKLN